MNEKEWQEVYSLVAQLRSYNVVDLVGEYYSQHSNVYPAYLLDKQINRVQALLDKR